MMKQSRLVFLLFFTILLMTFIVYSAKISSVTELKKIDSSKNSISWEWKNPIQAKFDQSIIYIDGINIKNTTKSTFSADDLACETNYTINIHTIDNKNKINSNYITLSSSTESCSEPSDEVIIMWFNSVQVEEYHWFKSILDNVLAIFIN